MKRAKYNSYGTWNKFQFIWNKFALYLTSQFPLSFEAELGIVSDLALVPGHDFRLLAQFLQMLPAHAQAQAFGRVGRDGRV